MSTRIKTNLKITSTDPDSNVECGISISASNRAKVEVVDELGYGITFIVEDENASRIADEFVALMGKCKKIIHDVGVPE